METTRNHSIIKNIGQVQSFQRNTGNLNNSKDKIKYSFNFKKMLINKKNTKETTS